MFAGSCAEYEWKTDYYFEDSTPLKPSSLYGRTKGDLREFCEELSDKTDLSTAWARLFFLYGPHGHRARIPASTIRSLLEGELAVCRHGDYVRDYLHIDDAARGMVRLLFSDVTGPINIAAGSGVALSDMVEVIARCMEREDLIRIHQHPGTEPPTIIADVQRARDLLEWRPTIGLDDGLEDTISWWRERE